MIHIQILEKRMDTSTDLPTKDALPNSIEEFLSYLAAMADGYNNELKWNEVAKLKADMMNCPQRWKSVTPEQIRSKCVELGMRAEDAKEIADLLQRRKDGHRLIPHNSYQNFVFQPDSSEV
jgi:hypothetical protein